MGSSGTDRAAPPRAGMQYHRYHQARVFAISPLPKIPGSQSRILPSFQRSRLDGISQ